MKIKLYGLTKEELFKIVNEELLTKISTKALAKRLNIHRGTLKRWILKKEVPLEYFNEINAMLFYSYEWVLSKEESYKQLNQFFTKSSLAKQLIDFTLDFIKKNYAINFKEYTLIEPCAGEGSFSLNFPLNTFKDVVALDIQPYDKSILCQNWFDYQPTNTKNIIIGNPPFGLRGNLALKFINYASKFSDFICFILPPLFNSNGKGSPMLRINKELKLVKELPLKKTIFSYPNDEEIKINTIFQIWTKLDSPFIQPTTIPNKKSEYIKVYSLSNGNESSKKRNVKMIGHCDYYLPSTSFHPLKLFSTFYELPNQRGYGIVILKDKEKIKKIIEEIDWQNEAFISTNSANNLNSQTIINALNKKIT